MVADGELGNHDITLDKQFYAEHSLDFHNQYPQDSQSCIELTKRYPSITYLNHESAELRLNKDGGPRTTFKVFGSPLSPVNGLWAFGYEHGEASNLWKHVPLETDIVITHTPPKFHCDESKGRGAVGCEALRQRLWEVRPKLAVCGHVHDGRGVERVLWDLESPHIQFKELETRYWIDPERDSKKQCLLDLTTKGGMPLENTDAFEAVDSGVYTSPNVPKSDWKLCGPWKCAVKPRKLLSNPQSSPRTPLEQASPLLSDDYWAQESSECKRYIDPEPRVTLGKSEIATSVCWHTRALVSRMGRKETAIVNAAIMGSGWHSRTISGKRYGKAIVVDLDLPIW